MKIFLTGATGYIGSSVAKFLADKGHIIYGLYRNPAKEAELRQLAIIPVLGTLEDQVLLDEYARLSDAVIHTADSDHRSAIETMLNALEGTGKTFIHTSGSSVVGDDVLGRSENPEIFDEESLFTPMEVRVKRTAINNMVRIAAVEKQIRTIVIVPSMIYGNSLGLDTESDQLPVVFRKSRELGKGVYLGKGVNRWSNVHIADLVELYDLALEKAPSAGYFYAENGEESYLDLAGYISRALGYGGEVGSWDAEDALAELGDWARFALGSNSRVRAVHARRLLGWKPKGESVSSWIAGQR
ncbi:NAD-dependent epimerase/dehydratase family protein [Pedobacter cryoconitis]|uniref:Nucleoside-diphosphate-sugar epimerase n=1 Tax=Pedobacter cryoconitis TaxID=188932 RepID=A0A7X0MKS5_9SPHI|nr:NAD-dependent epimerase/dehydratase family protein [Pedobacter cryoconitis]MBB6501020.1 nucleoside-diphosphate-sugar epimerase [Pedobacter cryoconitis]